MKTSSTAVALPCLRWSGASLLLLGALLLGGPGCAIGTQRYGRVIDPAQITDIRVGESTKQDVLDLFGPPTAYTRLAGSRLLRAGVEFGGPQGLSGEPGSDAAVSDEVFTYEYREDNERFFTVLLFTYFRRSVLADRLMIFFDEEDKVKYMAFAKETDAEPEASGDE